MKKILSFLVFILFFTQTYAQVGFAEQVQMWTPSRYFPEWVQLPDDYDPGKKYPLIMFIHGLGESASGGGGGLSDADAGYVAGDYLDNIYTNTQSLPYFRENGWSGKGYNPITKDSTEFIIISPQWVQWTNASQIRYFLTHAKNNYSIDTNRIYLTGFSNGGRGTFRYARGDANADAVPSQSVARADQPWLPAAVAPMSIADDYPVQAEADRIVDDSIHIWVFGSPDGDTYGKVADSLATKINRYKPGWSRWTEYSGGHCCWGQFYDPEYVANVNGTNMNLYSWFLLYSRDPDYYNDGGAPASTVNAGSDKSIGDDNTLLVGSATPGSGETIASYSWTKVSGGSATIVSPANISTTITGLANGVYVFRLTVTQSDSQTGYDDVTVTVNIPEPNDCGCDLIFDPAVNSTVNVTSPWQIQPGAVVCLKAGNYYRINFENVHGTAENPITIKNCGGEVVISSDYSGGMFRLINSSYVRVTGTGDAGYFYGIRTQKYNGDSTGSAFNFQGKIGNLEIDHVWGDYSRGFGFQVKTNPENFDRLTWHPYGSIPNIKIHDTKITNTGTEGYYIGYTNYNITVKTYDAGMNAVDTVVDAPAIIGLQFYNNIAEDNGWDGIQISAAEDIDAYNNVVRNYGKEEVSGQATGFQLGGRTWGKVYNNLIENGSNMGMFLMGYNHNVPPTLIYNNLVINAGLDGMSASDRPNGGKYPDQKYYILNNTIVSPARHGVTLYNDNATLADGNLFKNNLIVNPGSGYVTLNNPSKDKIDTTGNARIATVLGADFESGTYKLKSSSPAFNMHGYDASAYFNYDFDYQNRYGEFGMGAYRTFAPALLPIIIRNFFIIKGKMKIQ